MSLLRNTESKNKNNIVIKYIDVDITEEWEETKKPTTLLIIGWAVISTMVSYQYIKKMKRKKREE